MLEYPKRAIKSLAYLFRPYNDIDVYVEDSLNRNMYQILIERILDGKAKVKRIFPLQGRSEVLKACEADQIQLSRRRIYIIDGDMDIFLNTPRPEVLYLYRLAAYTSENLLISETAALEIAFESLPEEPHSDLSKKLALSTLIEDACTLLRPLFVVYAAKHFLAERDNKQVHIETAGYKVEQLGDDGQDGITLSPEKISKRIEKIKSMLMNDYQYSKADIDAAIAAIDGNLPAQKLELCRFISGKTYLLPLLFHRLRRLAKCSCSKEQLKTRLARYCETDVDQGFADAVLAVAQGGNLAI